MKLLAEYALVAAGAVFFGAALLQFGWLMTADAYPRSVPTLISIPACFIAMAVCFMKAAEISIATIK